MSRRRLSLDTGAEPSEGSVAGLAPGSRSKVLVFITWFVVGTIVAGTLQILRAEVAGGPAGLVSAGRLEPAHEVVQEHLPGTQVAEDHGHDGQIFYAIGTDLTSDAIPESLVPGYRYRRILYPALGSMFGLLDGTQLLWGLIVLAAVAAGLAGGAAGVIGERLRLPWLAPLAVILNPGVWLSAMLLTADGLALAFGLLALMAFLGHRDDWAWIALAAAALTRETHILFAVALGGFLWFRSERLRGLRYVAIPALPLTAWLGVVSLRVGNPLESGDGLAAPGAGLIGSLPLWSDVNGLQLFFTITALAAICLSVLTLARGSSLMRWLAGPWLVLALVSSSLIWDLGNNTIRTLAPMFTLGLLGSLPSRAPRPPTATGASKPDPGATEASP